MIYLRELKINRKAIVDTNLNIFEGDVNEDYQYWKGNYGDRVEVRYFELREKEIIK